MINLIEDLKIYNLTDSKNNLSNSKIVNDDLRKKRA